MCKLGMRKLITFNIEIESLKSLDAFVIAPCSRSDILNEIISYMLTNPETINHFVNSKMDQIKRVIDSNVNYE